MPRNRPHTPTATPTATCMLTPGRISIHTPIPPKSLHQHATVMPPTSGHRGVLRGFLTLAYVKAFENAEPKTATRKILAGPFIPRRGVLRGFLTVAYFKAFENAEPKTATRKILAGPFIPRLESQPLNIARIHSRPQNKHDPKQSRA